MATFFQTKISFLKQAENGSIYKKSEIYLLNAESFTEAEARLQACLEESIPEYNLLTVAKANITDVVFTEGAEAFYKATIVFISHDEDSGKEKKCKQPYLIQANSIEEANRILLERMAGTVVDYESIEIKKTNIVEVFTDEVKDEKEKTGIKVSVKVDGEWKDLPKSHPLVEGIDHDNSLDPLFKDAARLVVNKQMGSASMIQRELNLGYNRAGRIIDQLEEACIIGEFKGSAPREVLFQTVESLNPFLETYKK